MNLLPVTIGHSIDALLHNRYSILHRQVDCKKQAETIKSLLLVVSAKESGGVVSAKKSGGHSNLLMPSLPLTS